MGDAGAAHAIPVHGVTVADFELMRSEVTVSMYTACVQAGHCDVPACDETTTFMGEPSCNYVLAGKEDHPINYVTFAHAQQYANWTGTRLPSETEWEFAARSAGHALTYPWGHDAPSCELVDFSAADIECDGVGTSAVCSLSGKTLQGLCDLSGNVSEWTADEYQESYEGAPTDGSAWEASAAVTRRTVRGGSHHDDASALTSFSRAGESVNIASATLGFRLARVYRPACGNGLIDLGESCDDGNITNGDGCSQRCGIESGYGCDTDTVPNQCATLPACHESSEGCPVLDYAYLQPGEFSMGGNVDANEGPIHSVNVSPFWLMKNEVTIAQYRVCVDAGVCTAPADNYAAAASDADELPVRNITWAQAKAYAAFSGGQLPTEAEWEYAATGEGQPGLYPWGNDFAECAYNLANFSNCLGTVSDVCQFALGNTDQGICDLSGNVSEWVEDDYAANYDSTPVDGTAYLEDPRATTRVVRGGDYTSGIFDVRSAKRFSYAPDTANEFTGFRLAKTYQPKCGDGILSANEQCDDGNLTDGDGCSDACYFKTCSVDQRVLNQACVPCPESETNQAGDDPSGADTVCD